MNQQILNMQEQCPEMSAQLVKANAKILEQSAKLAVYREIARKIQVTAGMILDEKS